MLSERAKKYLATLQRESAVIDEAAIVAALHAQNLPIFQPVIQFQMDYGGYVERFGLVLFRWGLLHEKPDPDSFFAPNRLHFDFEDGEYYFTCANCHGSDHWTLDSQGRLAWCGYITSSSFEMKLERDAFGAELARSGKSQRIRFEDQRDEIAQSLIPLLQDAKIEHLSDQYSAFYLKDGLYVRLDLDDNTVHAWISGDKAPEILNHNHIPFRTWP
jgi:hypothetical protein